MEWINNIGKEKVLNFLTAMYAVCFSMSIGVFLKLLNWDIEITILAILVNVSLIIFLTLIMRKLMDLMLKKCKRVKWIVVVNAIYITAMSYFFDKVIINLAMHFYNNSKLFDLDISYSEALTAALTFYPMVILATFAVVKLYIDNKDVQKSKDEVTTHSKIE